MTTGTMKGNERRSEPRTPHQALLILTSGGSDSIDTATKLGAASLVISALLALYIGLAQMWNITFRRTVLPLYPWT